MRAEDLSFFEEKEFKDNLARYEQMMANGQSAYLEADELTDIAEYYMVREEKEKAMQCIHYALEIHPGSVDPLIFLARQRMFEDDIEEACRIRDSITDQNDREVYFFNAELLLRQEKDEEAEEYLTCICEAEEDKALFIYDAACLFLDYTCKEQALQWATKAVELEPENNKFRKLLAECHAEMEQYEKAIRIYNEMLDDDPYDIEAWDALGKTQFMGEMYTEAIETANFTLAIDEEDMLAMLVKADSLFKLKRYDEAHQIYYTYRNLCPTDENAYLFDGLCMLNTDHPQEALDLLLQAERLETEYNQLGNFQIYSSLAQVYCKMNDFDRAFEYIGKINGPEFEDMKELFFGNILLKNAQREQAAEHYDQYIEKSSDLSVAYLNVGINIVECGDPLWASTFLQKTLSVQNGNVDAIATAYAYLAYCTLMMSAQGHQEYEHQFTGYLHKACEVASESTLRYLFGKHFPEEVRPQDYYKYLLLHPDIIRIIGPSDIGAIDEI